MDNNNCLISIIVPVYKVEKELDRCVESLVAQTYPDIEIILIDDGSPDACPQLCDEWKRKDPRIKVIHKTNAGLSSARNTGLKIANGQYIMYVDSDDYIEKDSCEYLIGYMDYNVDIVVGVCKEIRINGVRYHKHTNLEIGKAYSAKEYIIKSIEANEWYAPAQFNLYSKKFLFENNLFFKEGYIFEDMEILPRLFLQARKIVYSGYIFYNYVIRSGSITTSAINEQSKKISVDIFDEWKALFDSVDDKELQNYLYGILIRYYLRNCRSHKVNTWSKAITKKFAMKYALNYKEYIKVIAFSVAPNIYIK